MSRTGGRHADLLRQREEGEHEGDDDRAEDQPEPVRPLARHAPRHARVAGRASGIDDPRAARQQDVARACALVDGHRSPARSDA